MLCFPIGVNLEQRGRLPLDLLFWNQLRRRLNFPRKVFIPFLNNLKKIECAGILN